MTGTTVSHYEILEKLGEGGMGVVYKARDVKLNRLVALKFLPPRFGTHEDLKRRFIREAEAASALDHAHICTIYEIDETEDGQLFIAMGYYGGKTLKEKIEQGPLPVEEAVDVAAQVASGLERAHEAGIVHRDIKPANVIVTERGEVKILDFGLAKLAGASKLTRVQSTLGTVSYMSPEQARGEEVDARTDLWSLGVMLYQMLTGTLPFRGDYDQVIIYAIQNTTPEPVRSLRAEVPESVEGVVARALEKDRESRYPSVSAMHGALAGSIKAIDAPGRPVQRWGGVGKRLAMAVGALAVLLVLTWWGSSSIWPDDSNSGVPRLGNPTRLTTAASPEDHPTWRPDGTEIAYESNERRNWDIWVLQVSSGRAVNRTADHGGDDRAPSWSPDGSQIAFWSDRKGGGCYVMPAVGGPARRLADAAAASETMGPPAPIWSPDGGRLACAKTGSWILTPYIDIVSLDGDTSPSRIDLSGRGFFNVRIAWSPDGSLLALSGAVHPDAPNSQIFVVSLDDTAVFTPVTDGEARDENAFWSSDGRYLYFISDRGGDRDIWRQQITPDGFPAGIAQQISTGLSARSAAFSKDGRQIVYSKGERVTNLYRVPVLENRPATWADARQVTFEQTFVGDPDISPDGKELVFVSGRRGTKALWRVPVEGGEVRPISTSPMAHFWSTWSPDGRMIAYHSQPEGNVFDRDLWVVSVEGGQPRQLTSGPSVDVCPAWSPDSEEIVFHTIGTENNDIWVIPATGGQPRQMTFEPSMDDLATWSPDGLWITFYSNRDGRNRIWRMPAEGGDAEPLTGETGMTTLSRWSPDGSTVFFAASRNENLNIWAVTVEDGTERQVTDMSGRPGNIRRHNFATDGKYLYFVWEEDVSDLWVMDVLDEH